MISLHEKSHSFLPFFGAWQPKLQEEIPRFLLQFIAFFIGIKLLRARVSLLHKNCWSAFFLTCRVTSHEWSPLNFGKRSLCSRPHNLIFFWRKTRHDASEEEEAVQKLEQLLHLQKKALH